MKEFFLDNKEVLTKFVEISAALAGSYYLRQTKNKKLRVFVYYLWITVAVEFLGRYSYTMQNNYDYQWFIDLKNSVFCSNVWLYNIYTYLGVGFLGIFYSDLLISKSFKFTIRSIFIGYSLFVFGYYTFTDAFFKKSIDYDAFIVALIIGIFVILYFIELINSEFILEYYKLPSFYISLALLFWHICATPLFIFDDYFRAVNENFVKFKVLTLLTINIITYSCIVFGFLYPLYKNKALKMNKLH
ncbi:MAG: hypothetical protein HRU26_09745 [Psychroserpens sp.]|nr:hypothetical protein [Psychroserpens sp.]